MGAVPNAEFWKPLYRIDDEWGLILVAEEQSLQLALDEVPTDMVLRVLPGTRCESVRKLHREIARTLDFPSYYGANWDALIECLADLEWMPARAYVLGVSDPLAVLTNSEKDFRVFVECLGHAASDWRAPATDDVTIRPKAFHVIWQCTPNDESAVRSRCSAAGIRLRDIRRSAR